MSPLLGKATSPGRSRWLVRGLLIVAAAVGFLVWALVGRQQRLVIENRSGQTIPFLQVTIANDKTTYQNVGTGSDVTPSREIKETDSFAIEGRLVDGKRFRASGKLGSTARIIVMPDGQLEMKPRDKGSF